MYVHRKYDKISNVSFKQQAKAKKMQQINQAFRQAFILCSKAQPAT
jgi:hypothetical protein